MNPHEDTATKVDTLTREMLAASLPGLSDHELDALAASAQDELYERIGQLLSAGLTDVQLHEFDTLLVVDVNGELCLKWLRDNVPTYSATVATVRARLVADVVETVSTADPSAVAGLRQFAEVGKASMKLIERYATSRALNCDRNAAGLIAQLEQTGERPALNVTIALARNGTLLRVHGWMTAGLPGSFTTTHEAFAAVWNAAQPLPKALVRKGAHPEPDRLTGEVTTLLPAFLTRPHLDGLIQQSIESIVAFSHAARAEGLV